jgi:hypothetical protein
MTLLFMSLRRFIEIGYFDGEYDHGLSINEPVHRHTQSRWSR